MEPWAKNALRSAEDPTLNKTTVAHTRRGCATLDGGNHDTRTHECINLAL